MRAGSNVGAPGAGTPGVPVRRGRERADRSDPRAPGRAGLLCCLRCGNWIDPQGALVSELLGAPAAGGARRAPAARARGPRPPVRPAPTAGGRAGGAGSLMLLGAIVIFQVASQRGSILSRDRAAAARLPAAGAGARRPADGLLDRHRDREVPRRERETLPARGPGLLAYGIVQIVEGVGLWGGWRWAEYLATIATSLFIPLEIYELVHKPTALKAMAPGRQRDRRHLPGLQGPPVRGPWRAREVPGRAPRLHTARRPAPLAVPLEPRS